MKFKIWRWTFLQWAKMYIVLAILAFIGLVLYGYFTLQPKGPSWYLELGLVLVIGLLGSVIFLLPAGIIYGLHLIFINIPIQDTTVFKTIWKKCSKEEKRKFQIVWILGILYIGVTLSPIPLMITLVSKSNWVGTILGFIGLILLLCGIPAVRRKVTASLSFLQEKQVELPS
jgi:hypothetical protein